MMPPDVDQAPLRLLLLYETLYPSTIGGIEQRNAELAVALAKRGHRVTLAGLGQAAEQNGVRVRSLGQTTRLYSANGRRSVRHTLRFVRALRQLDLASFDLVETANQFYLHLFPLRRACRRAAVPLAVTWYEHWGPYWRQYMSPAAALVSRWIEWRALSCGDALAATCELTRARVRAASGRSVELIPCGLDLRRVERACTSAPRAAELVFAGRLIAHKRVDLLLRALHQLAQDGLAPRLEVFGEGPEKARLQAQSAALGLAERVTFRDFVDTSEELWRALAGSALAVQPSAREGFGLFPLEAMAAGVPVVYCESPESAVGEVVRDGSEGLACSATAEGLAAAIARLLRSPEERRRLANGARLRARYYDWPAVAERFEVWCRETIRARRQGADASANAHTEHRSSS